MAEGNDKCCPFVQSAYKYPSHHMSACTIFPFNRKFTFRSGVILCSACNGFMFYFISIYYFYIVYVSFLLVDRSRRCDQVAIYRRQTSVMFSNSDIKDDVPVNTFFKAMQMHTANITTITVIWMYASAH